MVNISTYRVTMITANQTITSENVTVDQLSDLYYTWGQSIEKSKPRTITLPGKVSVSVDLSKVIIIKVEVEEDK